MVLSLPLTQYDTFCSTDLEAVRGHLGGIFCPHSLDLTERSSKINTRLHHARVAEMSLVYLDYGAPVDISPGMLNNFYLLQIVLSGKAAVSLDSTVHVAHSGEATIINPTSKTRIRTTEDCRFLSIRLDCKRVEQRLVVQLHEQLDVPLIFEPKLNLHTVNGATIYRFIEYFLSELDLVKLGKSRINMDERYEEMLTSMLLELQPHNYCENISKINSIPARHYVKRAEAYIRENYRDIITPDDIAAVVRVTPRTLYNGFNRLYETTPMGYLKSIRLEEARKCLKKAGHGDTVTRIAMSCGITHLGRFSCEYKELFGETPSQTLKKNRGIYFKGI